ncbi:DUF4345 domain-containing protein [Aeromicrobium phragmitis]|uniref:DUF4345 domain-containing protein n=1 Tax=Aeromicrobium phragmitis TaxID=2478914 RepID=A0A3L8PN05_9ACTN|nr:DUF4345 domain-containing protein [Aeromicrobium phragmitis]RLV56691.1 DUF4345 domain-containing protein [Aeromicrobium phragmitis]
MNPPNPTTPSALRTGLRVVAAVPLITGAAAAVLGPEFLPGAQGHVEANLAQEFRFFAVWWMAVSVYLWFLADRVESARREFAIVCGVLFASGLARWASFATHGWPHPMFVALAAVEVALPLPLVLLHRRVAEHAARRRSPSSTPASYN